MVPTSRLADTKLSNANIRNFTFAFAVPQLVPHTQTLITNSAKGKNQYMGPTDMFPVGADALANPDQAANPLTFDQLDRLMRDGQSGVVINNNNGGGMMPTANFNTSDCGSSLPLSVKLSSIKAQAHIQEKARMSYSAVGGPPL